MKFSVGDIAICTSYGGSRNHDWVGQEVEITGVDLFPIAPYPYSIRWGEYDNILCLEDELEPIEDRSANTLEDWS